MKDDVREESLPTYDNTFFSILANDRVVMPIPGEFLQKLERNYTWNDIGYNAVQRALTANPKIKQIADIFVLSILIHFVISRNTHIKIAHTESCHPPPLLFDFF